ncbi:KRAB [Lepeophtheirus salmonis]|uniref:KRAB n=1 Tax=Lepeophtheirus salmonis TaxID=72036 RepID=A0A7R8CQW8_LEPSM|nr:KRAB [Lepeophtheirus salmonis]CAF2899437.1 KRAB [Lepeophtheirus salmonis]
MGAPEVTDMPAPDNLPSLDLPPDISLEWSGMEIRAKIIGTDNFHRLFPNPSSKLTSNIESIHNRKKKKREDSNMTKVSASHGDGDRTKKCHICGKGFYKLTYLKRHILSHSNSKPIRCEICGWGFFQRENLDKHMSTHHSKNSSTKSSNDENEVPTTSSAPPKSTNDEKPRSSKKWECKVCGKKFIKHQIYQNHLTLHRNSKLYMCNICKRRFRDEFIWKKAYPITPFEKERQEIRDILIQLSLDQ